MAFFNFIIFGKNLNSIFLNTLRFSSKNAPDNSKCINKIILLGRCVTKAEMRPLNTNYYTSFVMATNEFRKTKNNEIIKRSDFHKIYVYQPFLAKKAHDLITKGTRVYIEGKLNYRKGTENHFTNIIADKLIFISGTNQNYEMENDETIYPEENEDEVPLEDVIEETKQESTN